MPTHESIRKLPLLATAFISGSVSNIDPLCTWASVQMTLGTHVLVKA